MNIIFFGTPNYVLPVLKKIHKKYLSRSGSSPIIAVVTQESKKTGRNQILEYSAVDEWAHKRKIPIHFDPMDIVKKYPNAELGILASFGKIIPKQVIEHFEHGILNVHPSLLPYWRGASPVQASIIEGGTVGSTIMLLDEKLDHGPIIDQFEDKLLEDDTTVSLRNRLFERSADVLVSLIPAYVNNKINLEEQVHENATFTTQIKKDDAFINPQAINSTLQGLPFKGVWKIPFMKDFTTHYTPTTVHNFIRAMQPWPQAWTTVRLRSGDLETKRLKLLKSCLEPLDANKFTDPDLDTRHDPPHTNHRLVLSEVQLEGKTAVSWRQFKEGYPDFTFTDQ